MKRAPLIALFQRTLMPKTLEQSVGVFKILTALLMIPRPFATGLTALETVYGITILPIALAVMWAIGGAVMLVMKRVGRKLFILLFLPCILYSLCLTWAFLLAPNVGPLGSAYSIAFWIVILWMHGKRSTLREQEGA